MKTKEFKVGDDVRGSWRDEATGKTYYQEGKIVHYPETGLWVQSQPDGGITPLKSFFSINKYDPANPLNIAKE